MFFYHHLAAVKKVWGGLERFFNFWNRLLIILILQISSDLGLQLNLTTLFWFCEDIFTQDVLHLHCVVFLDVSVPGLELHQSVSSEIQIP